MGISYRARVDERVFLNLPGFHGGAYVLAYVEDTRERGLFECDDPACTRCPRNFEPRIILVALSTPGGSASVAQRTEQRASNPRAEVRLLSEA